MIAVPEELPARRQDELHDSVSAALALLEAEDFEVLLVDHAMPIANGLELLRRAAQPRPAMRRLLVTGHHDLADVQSALHAAW